MKLLNISAALAATLVLSATLGAWHSATAATAVQPAVVSHQTAQTQFIDANGTRLAYRRFGKTGGVPLVFFQHFTGSMDNWDPKVIDGFAREREVILFDNAGIASSGGEVPETIEGMADVASHLVQALGLKQVDLLGFSMGGLIAQQVTLDHPRLVRRLVLVGTGPRGGEGMASLTPEAQAYWSKPHAVKDELWLDVFFTPSEKSQAAGREFLKRLRARTVNRDAEVGEKVAPAQVAALAKWGAPNADGYHYLKAIKQPVLVVNGSDDRIIYTINSYILQQNLPDAQLILYPDSAHGAQYAYPDLFVKQVGIFLNENN